MANVREAIVDITLNNL